jgi:CDP-glucose 4,6-dehydratase
LAGYYLFLEASRRGDSLPIALNFGPDAQNIKSVGEVIKVIQGQFSDFVFETHSPLMGQKETKLLTLNSHLAKDLLGWENQLSFEKSVELALVALSGSAPEVASSNQVKDFVRTSSQLSK